MLLAQACLIMEGSAGKEKTQNIESFQTRVEAFKK